MLMANDAQGSPAGNDEKTWGEKHRDIVEQEVAAINTRRGEERPLVYPGPDKPLDAVGLALSGGGIRSAAVCLGVLQGLNHHGLLSRIDYLSTVSGGGYMGSSFTATMTRTGAFAFGLGKGDGKEKATEIKDTPAVGHLRNYSNYLIPAGFRDALTGVAIVARGLVANLGLTLPVVLLLAALTIFSNPARSCLEVANFFGVELAASQRSSVLLLYLPKTLAFTSLGAVVALCLIVLSGVMRWLGNRFATPTVYLAGIALAMGAICDFARFVSVENFALTLASALLGLLFFFVWALLRSFAPPDRLPEFRGHGPTIAATYLVLVVLIGFFEFQPFMVAGMFDVADGASGQSSGLVTGVAVGWIKSLAAITAPIAGVVTLFRQQFADLLKGNSVSSEIGSMVLAYAAKAAVWAAGAALPLLIWMGYLYLCYWGIPNDVIAGQKPACSLSEAEQASANGQGLPARAADSFAGKIQFDSQAKSFTAEITSKAGSKATDRKPTVTPTSHVPAWLAAPAAWLFGFTGNRSMAWLYVVAAGLMFFLSWWLRPNANSLHRLYRDRLSKAFLFDPTPPKPAEAKRPDDAKRDETSLDQGRDFEPLDDVKLSDLMYPGLRRLPADQGGKRMSPAQQKAQVPAEKLQAPYHLINSALNVQGSDYANRRGRNADFFLFSSKYVGSEATGYAPTEAFEKLVPGLDLATAVAISGAAASSNMGSNSIRPLTPTLALLNVRLGYWLRNPRYLTEWMKNEARRRASVLYLWSEISGRLYENSDAVYLTDGGHIENLGVYELLRRRCRVIIAVDAEADAAMHFSSLVALQRYARIDLGIRIDLPWAPIQATTLAWMNSNAGKPPSPAPTASDGPHVAIGIIDYGDGEKGYLVYIKSSLTGEENDYIRDYARRFNRFPQETTGDQFFSEEQFEVYRSLGFHMTHGFLDAKHDVVAAVGSDPRAKVKFDRADVASIQQVRTALGLPEVIAT
jgi:predicted acylesterase/phospholipase RssA